MQPAIRSPSDDARSLRRLRGHGRRLAARTGATRRRARDRRAGPGAAAARAPAIRPRARRRCSSPSATSPALRACARSPRRCHHAATGRLAARLRPDVVALLGRRPVPPRHAQRVPRLVPSDVGALLKRADAPRRRQPRVRDARRRRLLHLLRRARRDRAGAATTPTTSGAWHVVVLNSNCAIVSCAAGSPQERWLRADLAAHPRRCTLAYWHHPRFTSGYNRDFVETAPLWSALHDAGADLVLPGTTTATSASRPRTRPAAATRRAGCAASSSARAARSCASSARSSPTASAARTRRSACSRSPCAPRGYSWRFVPEPGYAFTRRGLGPLPLTALP